MRIYTYYIIWSSELNSPIPLHLSSLIPRMLMFTLAISCLTTSNLPCFMYLTFQVLVAILLFTELHLASITSHIHNWV